MMFNPRPGQDKVIQYQGGFLAVPAVPGAGKTTVLAHLAANLIEQKYIKNGKILIVTVMNSAVANFRKKIGDELVNRGLPRNKGYEVKTLHSLAMTILKEKPEFLLINQNFQVIDETHRNDIINQLTRTWMFENDDSWKGLIKLNENNSWYRKALDKWENKDLPNLFRDGVSSIKAKGMTNKQINELQQQLDKKSYLSWVLMVYQQYNQILNNEGLLDFDDLIVQSVRLLEEDSGVLERLQKRWPFVFEDEAQDSTPLQEKILKMLSQKSGNLVRVGDSNQAIMGTFTPAEPEIFRRYCNSEGINKENILYSSRSSIQIINLANHLVDWVNNSHPQKECRQALEKQHIHPVDENDPHSNPIVNGYTIGVKQFNDSDAEVRGVAKLASEYVKKHPDKKVAILVPNRFVQNDIKDVLIEQKVPFEEVGNVTSKQERTIFEVETVLEYLAQPQKSERLTSVITKVFLNELDDEEWLFNLFNKYPLEQVVYPIGGKMPWLKMPDELSDPTVYTSFVESIEKVKKWLQASIVLPPDELVLYLAEDMGLESEQMGIAHNLALMIRQRMNDNPNYHLSDIAIDLPEFKEPMRHFLKIVNEQQGFEPTAGVISLITTHKSKGLEWNTVYLTGVTSAEYPSRLTNRLRSEMWYLVEDFNNPSALIKAELKAFTGQTVTNPQYQFKIDEISERLRLLYVGITRAKENLLLTYHQKNIFNKNVGPSLVLNALKGHIKKERTVHAVK